MKNRQRLASAFTTTIAEIVNWTKKAADFVITRGWRVQSLVALVIFLFVISQAGFRSNPELAIFVAVLSAVCWFLISSDYVLAQSLQGLLNNTNRHRLEWISLGTFANIDNLSAKYLDPPLGENCFNDVPFVLTSKVFDTAATTARAAQLVLDKPVRRVTTVHLLINAGNAYKRHKNVSLEGVTIGRILLWFNDQTSQETKLVLGQNIREWAPGNKPGELVDSVTDQQNQVAWKGKNTSGNDAIIDHLKIPIEYRNWEKELCRIVVTRDTRPSTAEDVLAFSIFAITLESY